MCMHSSVKNDQKIIDNILQRISDISTLKHHSILEFYGYCLENSLYILTEYYESNQILFNIISNEEQYFNCTEQLILLYGIAAGISYLHSHNIIHGSVTTSNILISKEKYPKINYYFNTQKSNENINNLEIIKNDIYTPPEIWKGEEYTKSSDVYSFAIVAYQILCFKRPFQNLTLIELISKIINGDRPEFESMIPECYKNLICKCWSSDPKDRPSFNEIVDLLKHKREFITEYEVDEEKFNEYINYVDNENYEKRYFEGLLNKIDYNELFRGVESTNYTSEFRQSIRKDHY